VRHRARRRVVGGQQHRARAAPACRAPNPSNSSRFETGKREEERRGWWPVPSPQPSLGPVNRVRVRRKSRSVMPGSTSPSRSSKRSPLTANTTGSAAGGGVEEVEEAIAPRRSGVRVGIRFPSGSPSAASLLSTVLDFHSHWLTRDRQGRGRRQIPRALTATPDRCLTRASCRLAAEAATPRDDGEPAWLRGGAGGCMGRS
jgi:hypothetical protein